MSGVVIVDDYADEEVIDEPISAEDEKNLKEIEDYIFNNVLGDDDENFEMMRKTKEEEAMEEIELAMLSAQSKAFSPGSYSNHNTNKNINTSYNPNSGYNSSNNYASYENDMNGSGQYDYTEDWYSDYKDCTCCGGYTYKCFCVSNGGYPSCANCNSHMNMSNEYNDSGNQHQFGNNYTTSNNSSSLSTAASEFVPSFTPSNYGNNSYTEFQPKNSYPDTSIAQNSYFQSRNSYSGNNGRGGSRGGSSNTTPCIMFSKEGYCKHGNKCKFAHV